MQVVMKEIIFQDEYKHKQQGRNETKTNIRIYFQLLTFVTKKILVCSVTTFNWILCKMFASCYILCYIRRRKATNGVKCRILEEFIYLFTYLLKMLPL